VPYLVGFIVLFGLTLILLSQRRLASLGLPKGRVIALDTLDLKQADLALYDPVFHLTGRPDYLVEQAGRVIPVEVKSGRAPKRPWPGQVLQLAAYCRLVHVSTGERPPYGVLKYADRAFAVDYDGSLETSLRNVLTEMRRSEGKEMDRSHESPGRCRGCGYRDRCEQRLDGSTPGV
jgi:CRISPR-associated exonuclease Cas4